MSVLRAAVPVLLGTSLVLGTGLYAHGARAAESIDRALVVAAEPVYQSVSYSVPSEQCTLIEEPVATEARYTSFTGPILGAIIGGAIGNAVGHKKTNKKVGTAVGAVLGGAIGRDIQHRSARNRMDSGHTRWQTREACETVYEYRERQELSGYDVTYRYAGQEHTTRMDHNPGRYLQVRVRVTPV